MVSRKDYNELMVKAAKSVLLELAHVLGAYRDNIVVIGGWVPPLLFGPGAHVGSTDVDLALDHKAVTDAAYAKIGELLLARGFTPDAKNPFMFRRAVRVESRTISVEVDFLSGEYGGAAGARRHQKVQDIKARKARGCDLVFSMFTEVRVDGELPDGGKDSVTVKVASIVPFLAMKGMALHDRLKEKDAWDIFYIASAAIPAAWRPWPLK